MTYLLDDPQFERVTDFDRLVYKLLGDEILGVV